MDSQRLKSICKTDAGKAKCDVFAPLLTELMPKWGIDAPQRQAMFLAQVLHESAEFTHLKESFKYSTAERLMAVSVTARTKGLLAVQAALKAGDESVAALMYGGKNGNNTYGDGLKYRGRGLIGITFLSNYVECGNGIKQPLVEHPELLEIPIFAVASACWFWQSRKLNKHADLGAITACSIVINGGNNGLVDRKDYWKRAQLALGAKL